MCEELVAACKGVSGGASPECAKTAERGLSDSRNEDQCYAVYDDCLPECQFYSEHPADAGALDASLGDAATPVTDASSEAGTDGG